MADQTYETIIVEKERGRARITLNRPEKLNAPSAQLPRELRHALFDADPDTRLHSASFKVERRDHRPRDQVAFMKGLEVAGPKAGAEFKAWEPR